MNYVEPIRSTEDIDMMCDYLREWNERNYIMFLIGINTSLRISDIVILKVSNIRGHYIIVIEKKTKKRKRIKMNSLLKREIERYIKGKKVGDYLFQSRKGKNKPITRQAAYCIIKIAALDCGIENVGTHTMRKTFGYHYYKKHKDIAMLMDLFNHSSPAITKRYIGINQDQQDRAFASFKLGK
ncbi:TPA: site-specific integrase [Streptococcus suis]|uniref:site-specific integrase n=1 Tax=Streptococcus suis TaxID=1307 RepID=UPI00041321E6|nr:site-specific integrase [Streptococcus suis]NQM40671.1 site-specific integrase [Streptococcus suis]WNO82463.1 site-specific integrase [Streptococcus suis]HEM3172938.1 site-specific integrase [Streptococcus suis]HEM4055188.1 site-specific integrase [Streptococcus suis]HEM4059067.1 site-specific integrase [Streptococcus suis]